MFFHTINREQLNDLFQVIRLQQNNGFETLDNKVKIEQVLAYLEQICSELKKISLKKTVRIVDCGAGNCYLSFIVYYYLKVLNGIDIEIHCIDINERLMNNKRDTAAKLLFNSMYFYAMDIDEFDAVKKVDMVYSLHACDSATDKSMHLALKLNARIIFSAACCQHSISIKSELFKGLVRYQIFRERLLMMVSDSLRALILEEKGYKVDIYEFVSSRYTEKNILVRAVKKDFKRLLNPVVEYEKLKNEFKTMPALAQLVNEG